MELRFLTNSLNDPKHLATIVANHIHRAHSPLFRDTCFLSGRTIKTSSNTKTLIDISNWDYYDRKPNKVKHPELKEELSFKKDHISEQQVIQNEETFTKYSFKQGKHGRSRPWNMLVNEPIDEIEHKASYEAWEKVIGLTHNNSSVKNGKSEYFGDIHFTHGPELKGDFRHMDIDDFENWLGLQ